MDGYELRVQDEIRIRSIEAAWLLNGLPARIGGAVGAAFAGKRPKLKEVKLTDLYDPDKESKKERSARELAAMRREGRKVLAQFPKTLPPPGRVANGKPLTRAELEALVKK